MRKMFVALTAIIGLTGGASAMPSSTVSSTPQAVQLVDWYCGPHCQQRHYWHRQQWSNPYRPYYGNPYRHRYYGYGYNGYGYNRGW